MELVLSRTYHTDGTNGRLYINNSFQCYTIELPWENNLPQYSCIPEGCYSLKKRYSNKFGQHLLVDDVPGRELILVHPANDALKELRGCIAPVSILKGPGKGMLSRNAFSRVVSLVYEALKKETVFIIIKKDQDESSAKNRSAHSEVLQESKEYRTGAGCDKCDFVNHTGSTTYGTGKDCRLPGRGGQRGICR